jgi:hypothetical protein
MRGLLRIISALLVSLGMVGVCAGQADGPPSGASLLETPAPLRQPESQTLDVEQIGFRLDGFGVRNSSRFLFGARGARDFDDNTDASLFVQQTWFVVDDVEIGYEGAAWWIFQGDDTFGFSASLVARYHFLQRARFSLFAEGNIGVLVAADTVPEDGTSFDFIPRLGAGATFPVSADGTRLVVGFHWHHISNARINGEARNPARNAPALYVALSVPF